MEDDKIEVIELEDVSSDSFSDRVNGGKFEEKKIIQLGFFKGVLVLIIGVSVLTLAFFSFSILIAIFLGLFFISRLFKWISR